MVSVGKKILVVVSVMLGVAIALFISSYVVKHFQYNIEQSVDNIADNIVEKAESVERGPTFKYAKSAFFEAGDTIKEFITSRVDARRLRELENQGNDRSIEGSDDPAAEKNAAQANCNKVGANGKVDTELAKNGLQPCPAATNTTPNTQAANPSTTNTAAAIQQAAEQNQSTVPEPIKEPKNIALQANSPKYSKITPINTDKMDHPTGMSGAKIKPEEANQLPEIIYSYEQKGKDMEMRTIFLTYLALQDFEKRVGEGRDFSSDLFIFKKFSPVFPATIPVLPKVTSMSVKSHDEILTEYNNMYNELSYDDFMSNPDHSLWQRIIFQIKRFIGIKKVNEEIGSDNKIATLQKLLIAHNYSDALTLANTMIFINQDFVNFKENLSNIVAVNNLITTIKQELVRVLISGINISAVGDEIEIN